MKGGAHHAAPVSYTHLTVSLGTQYVTVPDLTNYVQADAEQQLKELGVSVLVTQAVDCLLYTSGVYARPGPCAPL